MDPFPSSPFSSENNSDESFSASDSSCSTGGGAGYAEPELMLASENPKKRAGRKKFKETRHPVYRGVRSRNSGKWVCEVREPNKKSRLWLGTHATAEMAARAHDVAVLAMRGRSACLNFADSVWRLPVPESNDVRDIQKAAALAAALFKQKEYTAEEVDRNEFYAAVKDEFYAGEEEMFGTPGFMDSMAEGLMVQPFQTPVGYDEFVENMDFCVDLSLWSF